MTTQVSNTVSIAAASKVGTSQSDKDILNLVLNELAAIRMMLGCATGGTGAGALVGSEVYDPANLADGAGATSTGATITGAALGDLVIGSCSLDLQGILATYYVSATDTCKTRFQNESGGAVDLASLTIRYLVIPKAAVAQVLPAMVLTA